MTTERLNMHKTREILRQRWVLGRSHREVRQSTGASVGAVWLCLTRAQRAGLDWATVEAMSDEELEARLYGRGAKGGDRKRPEPDWARIDLELRRSGVTLELLHVEYL